MTHRFTLSIILFLLLLAAGCAPEIEPPIPKSGSLDFSRFIVVGSSGASGITNSQIDFEGKGWLSGGTYEDGQFMSWSYIMAQQSRKAQNFQFLQPLASGNGSGYARLIGFNSPECYQTPASPVYDPQTADGNWDTNISNQGPFNNLAMPDMKLKDVSSREYLACNSYSQRMVSTGTSADSLHYLALVANNDPTFFAHGFRDGRCLALCLIWRKKPRATPHFSRGF